MKCYNCGSGAGLSRSGDKIFISGDFAQSHRASGVKFLCGDADFGAEAELAAVGEGCRHVGVHACCIYRSKEALGSFDVLGDDALAVFGAVASNEVQSLVDVGHCVEGEFVVEP